MGIERTSESFIPSQKNEGGKYLTTDGNNAFWDTVSSGISGNYVASISGTTNEIEVSGSGSSSASVILSLPSTINANTTGNAATATKLQTARSIALSGDVSGSANFDGSAGISITATVADDSHNHIISNIDGLQTALDEKLASASYTASDVLTKIKTVDGSTSGLDADLLDGQDGSHYLDWTNVTNKPDPTITLGGDASGSLTLTDLAGGTLTVTVADDSHNHIISNVDGLQTSLDGKQPIDADLTAIAALSGTSGFLKKTAADTWSLDTSSYITGNQTITLSGDVSGSGTTSIEVTIADDSHNHIVSNIDGLQTILDAKAPLDSPALTGTPTAPTASASANSTQIATTAFVQTAVSNLINGAPGALNTLDELAAALGDDANFASTVTNSLAGKQPIDADLTAIAALSGTSGFLKKTAADTWSLDTNTYLTGNQSISISGDATGSGTTSISLTLANTAVTPASYGSASAVSTFTVDSKGRLTAASNTAIAIAQSAVTNLTTDLAAKAPLASPTFTGTVVLPSTTSIGDVSNTEISYLDGVTSAIQTQLNAKANLASPALTGTPTAPTAAVDTNTTQIATTAYVIGQAYAKLASPALSGTPTAPTAAVGTNTTQVATTAFVNAEISNDAILKSGGTMTGTLILPASTTTVPSIRVPHGTAPTSPTNGDIWTTTSGLFARINGGTVGPYGIGTARTFYQTTAPSSPATGDIWVDSDETYQTINSNDYMPKSGGTFTGAVSGITPTSNSHFATKEYVDNNAPAPVESGFSAFLLAGM